MRWLATQKLFDKSDLSAVLTILYMSPASTLSLSPFVLLVEQDEIAILAEPSVFAQYALLVLFPGLLAFILLIVEVQLVKVTSSLTLSVFGVLKSVVMIIFSVLVFGD